MTQAVLNLSDLQAGYGDALVVRGVHAHVRSGEIVALLGRNGSGRSTLAKAVMGMVDWQGEVTWDGTPLAGRKTFEIARMGIGYVPESRDVFSGLTVHENLILGHRPLSWRAASAEMQADALYRLFPALLARRDVDAALLSGGEQQMLSLCRCLMGSPRLVIVDEPTEGLAPALVQQVARCLQGLRRSGGAVLLIEQKGVIALSIADRVLVMGQGRIVFNGHPGEFRARPDLTQQWLQV